MKALKFLKDLIRSKHIQLALVSGTSIIALAYVSKRVLPEPMGSIYILIPALFVTAAEGVMGIKRKKWYSNINYWLITVALATILIIFSHLAAVPDPGGNPGLEKELQAVIDEFLEELSLIHI